MPQSYCRTVPMRSVFNFMCSLETFPTALIRLRENQIFAGRLFPSCRGTPKRAFLPTLTPPLKTPLNCPCNGNCFTCGPAAFLSCTIRQALPSSLWIDLFASSVLYGDRQGRLCRKLSIAQQ